MPKTVKIALVGDHDPQVTAHRAIPIALDLVAQSLGCECHVEWLRTDGFSGPVAEGLKGYDGIWLVPASPYADGEAAMAAARFARENGIPFLGTCGGYQHALIEFFRSVIGLVQADSQENDPDALELVVRPLTCALVEVTGEIHLVPGSRMAEIYGSPTAREGYRCSFGFNSDYAGMLEGTGMTISAHDTDGDPRAFDLAGHPFFHGTGYQPERAALEGRNHPLVKAFLSAGLLDQ